MQKELETKPSGVGSSLDKFIDSDQEEDIYEMYQKKLQERPEAKEDVKQEVNYTINKDTHNPQMPRFEEYFNNVKDGVHPFDKITDEVNESVRKDKENETDDYDRELHERELLGRLMGEKLTPRQFDLLVGLHSDENAKLRYVKDNQNDAFMQKRDVIRLFEEQLEKLRRQRVMSGEWSEAASH